MKDPGDSVARQCLWERLAARLLAALRWLIRDGEASLANLRWLG